ncbi:MAG TPA: hypothetical protein VJZ91_14745 [Blastocatellia bacterium]|nr:hypothetical protein [Blastocatellia bacterium]
MKKLSTVRSLLIFTAMLACAATARAQSAIANLPESDAVVTVNARRILTETLPRLLTAEQMAGVQATLEKAKKVANFDVASIESAVIGLRLNRSKPLSAPGMLLVMRGSFNADALVSLIKIGLKDKVREEKYGAKAMALLKLSDLMSSGGTASRPTEIALVALDGGTLAVGLPAYVKAALDADAGKGRIKPELVQMLGREPESLVRVALLVPQGFFNGILPKDAQGSEEIGRLAGSIEQIYLSFNMDAQSFPLTLVLKSNTADNAHAIAGLLQTIAQMGTSTTDKNVKPIIEALKITSQEAEVQVRTALPQEMIASFVRALFASATATKPAQTKKQ